jgi:hypothetical protein
MALQTNARKIINWKKNHTKINKHEQVIKQTRSLVPGRPFKALKQRQVSSTKTGPFTFNFQ